MPPRPAKIAGLLTYEAVGCNTRRSCAARAAVASASADKTLQNGLSRMAAYRLCVLTAVAGPGRNARASTTRPGPFAQMIDPCKCRLGLATRRHAGVGCAAP